MGALLQAQNENKFNFIGLNPGVTVEPLYEKGEWDINIIPIVYQRPLTKRVDARLTTICNLGIRNDGNELSHVGLEMAFPLFLKPKESVRQSSKGLFFAPMISLTRNRRENHNNVGLWLEPGYNFLFDNAFALSIGIQLGGTYFAFDNGHTEWNNHLGVKVIFGKWI